MADERASGRRGGRARGMRAAVLGAAILGAAILGASILSADPARACGPAGAAEGRESPLAHWAQIAGSWAIEDADGRRIGEIAFGVGGAIGAQGRLAARMEEAPGREFFADTRTLERDRLVLNIFRGIGDRAPGALTLTRDRASPPAIVPGLLDEGGGWRRVRLLREAGHAGDSFDAQDGPDDDLLADLPGIGVSGPPYRLRGLPPGGSVGLRAAPGAASAVIGALAAGEEDILVHECRPEIETLAFEESDAAGRLALLDGAVCRASTAPAPCSESVSGWIEGRFLAPMAERMQERADAPLPPRGDRLFDHNGSTMRLELAADGSVRIVYERPRAGLAAIGVEPGALLVDGSVDAAGRFEGRARLFSGRCETLAYPVRGALVPGENLVLVGEAPVRDRASCAVVGSRRDGGAARLLFEPLP